MPEVETPVTPEAELALIRAVAQEAGRIAMRFFGRDPEVWMKEGQSPVSEADMAVDAFLKDALLTARPDYGWISEETVDERAAIVRRRFFVVDPIDGTRAFIAGKDVWCVSIGIVENDRPLAGVLDCPARGEVVEASLGTGARQNGRDIKVVDLASQDRLKIAMARSALALLPEDFRSRVEPYPYVPSLAYRIAMVARGEIAGTFVRPNSHDWDLAAADLILAEAGGEVVTADAERLRYGGPTHKHGTLVAASGPLLDEMLGVVAQTAFG
ncbi:3'(2'),5'-bisphosphate nucleotidase CysQ [Phyllobacterium phragmitis]|uniref:3'(2'),5'-bisphosphate nucleotidase CysQ n=1 Tax=Phyllobacterium phragmitis TaxID=2670329 RepID=A0A2S9IMN5_9HYPH|nr:3'(2'),5'-bisphosphate nucleotidase CysQ [Phyllobacterium phragmitis]PRD41793.1 3'(2'),5'-bisphosphate nucleotidase CysQ [Phyllobacterium phragmitis]